MSRTMLMTGSEGMLATDLAAAAATAGYTVRGYSHAAFDIADMARAAEILDAVQPDVFVNTPGLMVDLCEEQPDEARRIHTWAPAQLAQLCERSGTVFVYVSTCGLFGDAVRYYAEDDAVTLKTHYARSKYEGEQAAAAACQRTFVIRPGWLFGGTISHKRNFVYQRYRDAQQRAVLPSVVDKCGSPTWTVDLSGMLLQLLETEAYGTYHVTNAGGGSRYDYVKHIVEAFGLPTVVEPVDSSQFPRSAPVPDCEMLANARLQRLGLHPLGAWQEAIDRFVAQLRPVVAHE